MTATPPLALTDGYALPVIVRCYMEAHGRGLADAIGLLWLGGLIRPCPLVSAELVTGKSAWTSGLRGLRPQSARPTSTDSEANPLAVFYRPGADG